MENNTNCHENEKGDGLYAEYVKAETAEYWPYETEQIHALKWFIRDSTDGQAVGTIELQFAGGQLPKFVARKLREDNYELLAERESMERALRAAIRKIHEG